MYRPEHVPNLEQAGGDARVWGRWYEGGLQEVRLAIDIPELVLRQDIQFAVLRNIQAQGEWQREGEGGEAWLSGNAESVDWAEPGEAIEGPALPHHWYLSHRPGQWALRTSAFELALTHCLARLRIVTRIRDAGTGNAGSEGAGARAELRPEGG